MRDFTHLTKCDIIIVKKVKARKAMSFAGKVKELLKKNGMTKAELATDAGIA